MKVLMVLASMVLVIKASTDEELWIQFKKQHNHDYENSREERERFSVFQINLRKIEAHNQKYERGESSWYMGINQFTDKTETEIEAMFNPSERPLLESPVVYYEFKAAAIPDYINWLENEAVTPVKNQGNCSSCWAFSITGTLEGQYAIKYGKLISLSEQDLIDCSRSYGNNDCRGGYAIRSYKYVKENGIESEENYPYLAKLSTCVHNNSLSVFTMDEAVYIPKGDEIALQNVIAFIGPAATNIYGGPISSYAGGIFDNEEDCANYVLNHSVLIVGYGTEDGKDYWIAKNSWGPDWGDQGYFKIVRNKNSQCGLADEASFAKIQ